MVEKIVSSQVKCINLKDRLTLIDLERIFHDICIAIDSELAQESHGSILEFMLPPPVSKTYFTYKI